MSSRETLSDKMLGLPNMGGIRHSIITFLSRVRTPRGRQSKKKKKHSAVLFV